MKLVFKSNNCADTLSAVLPPAFEDMKACLLYLNHTGLLFSDGFNWHILHDDEIVCLILGNEMLCKYVKED